MFQWLKNLFKKDADLFLDDDNDRWWESKDIEPVIRVGNGPEQTGTQPGEGFGWKGSPVLKEATERLNDAVEKASTAIETPTWEPTGEPAVDQPIVWAPVNTPVVSKPTAVRSKSNAAFREAVEEMKKGERKPKKLNKGLAAKAKKAKSKAKSKKKV